MYSLLLIFSQADFFSSDEYLKDRAARQTPGYLKEVDAELLDDYITDDGCPFHGD